MRKWSLNDTQQLTQGHIVVNEREGTQVQVCVPFILQGVGQTGSELRVVPGKGSPVEL